MVENDLKTKIKEVAVNHFNRDGYYGATIRNITRDVDCSLPMVYYYYQSKKDLFHEIIKKDYFDLLKRQAEMINEKTILDFYTEFVFKINFLSDYEKKVYRLGVKVYLSFDGDEELMEMMDKWEESIIPRHYQIVSPYLKDIQEEGKKMVIVRTLVHLLENLIEQIVVKNRSLSKNEIREELSLIIGNI